jgi:ElaA protein
MSKIKTITEWKWCQFKDLSCLELYKIMALRQAVFIVEQNCAYQDLDNLDELAWHLMGNNKTELIAYLRVLPPETRFAEHSVGRVITKTGYRNKGLGKHLMKQAFMFIKENHGPVSVRISAQAYLQKFYESLGFTVVSDEYLEDGILHLEMLLQIV